MKDEEPDVVERVLQLQLGYNSLTLFRQSLRNETVADSAHSQWLRDGTVHVITANYCEDILNHEALKGLFNGR